MNTNVANTVPATKVCPAVPGEMDTMKMRGDFKGATNGAKVVHHFAAEPVAAEPVAVEPESPA
ncbi:hypothetical protein [Paraburkholderia dipogonis]|uniref:hypothetical protein n=1 Tax=Paraburkholderia dipogonis TaxID=1211383 RepID=UPI0038B7B1B3